MARTIHRACARPADDAHVSRGDLMNAESSKLRSTFRIRVLCTAIAAALAAGDVLGQDEDDPFSLEDEPVAEPQDVEALAAKRRALTETRNWVELGAGWVSDDSFKFGKYN